MLELAYFEGLALQEISEQLSIPVGTAKSRLSRALAKLRDEMQINSAGTDLRDAPYQGA